MVAKIIMTFSAVIVFALGLIHLVYTFHGSMLTPRDPALQASMREISPVITRETTMWQCWTGFNASHSAGLMLFGLIFGYLAWSQPEILFRSPLLLVIGLAMIGSMAILAKLYFFSVPFIGVSTALVCYLASILVSRA